MSIRKWAVLNTLLLVGLLACGSNENAIAPSDAVTLLADASNKVAAGKFSYHSRSMFIVDTGDGEQEQIYSTADSYIDPDKGWFSDGETNDLVSEPQRISIVRIGHRAYHFVETRSCYVDNPAISYNPFSFFTLEELRARQDYISGERIIADGKNTERITLELPKETMTMTIQDGLLVEQTAYSDEFHYGGAVGDSFEGKIIANKITARIYDIGVEKELPTPEPICR